MLNAFPATPPAGNRTPAGEPSLIDVRNHSGDLIGRVPAAKADELEAAGLACRVKRYLLLNRAEPIIDRPWRGGSHTTERIRNDQGIICAPDFHLKHRDLPR